MPSVSPADVCQTPKNDPGHRMASFPAPTSYSSLLSHFSPLCFLFAKQISESLGSRRGMLISIRPSVNVPPANPYGTVTVSNPLCLTSPVGALRLNCHMRHRMEAKEMTQAGRRQVEKLQLRNGGWRKAILKRFTIKCCQRGGERGTS